MLFMSFKERAILKICRVSPIW